MTTTIQIVTDAHISSDQKIGRKMTESAITTLDTVLSAGQRRSKTDAVIDLGDLIEHSSGSGDLNSIDYNNLKTARSVFDQLEVPSYFCIGNHPLMNLDEKAVLSALRLDNPYYSIDLAEHKIIMLHSRFSNKKDLPNAKSGSGIHIDQEQLKWLENEMEKSEKNILVCCHHPISTQDLTGNHWFEKYPQCALMDNGKEVQEMLAKSGKVIAVFNGHTHWNYLAVDEFGTPHVTLQSLSEDFTNRNQTSESYAISVLKNNTFNYEIFGNDLTCQNLFPSHQTYFSELAKVYDSIAPTYDNKTKEFGANEERIFDDLIGMLKVGHGNRVVDFGCGPGRDVPYYAKKGFQVIGVDGSKELLKIARNRSPEQTFINADFTNVSLEPNSAAIVIHNSSLQHVSRESIKAALETANKVLEPNGIFYCHYRSGVGESLSISTEYGKPIQRYIALYEAEEIEGLMKEIGFEVLNSDTFDHKYSGLKGETVQYKTRTWARKPSI